VEATCEGHEGLAEQAHYRRDANNGAKFTGGDFILRRKKLSNGSGVGSEEEVRGSVIKYLRRA
jgi:hypothetical protein